MPAPKKKDRDRHSQYFTIRLKKAELRELKASARKRFKGNVSAEIRERLFPTKSVLAVIASEQRELG